MSGRGERIRTSDPLHPMQVRYQAAPRPDRYEIGSSPRGCHTATENDRCVL